MYTTLTPYLNQPNRRYWSGRNAWNTLSMLDQKARSNNQGLVDAVNETLQNISGIVRITDPTAIVGYLSRYPDLINLVAEMAGETFQVCPASELTLQYSIDIESGAEDLALFVRYSSYPSGFLNTLESINDKYDAQLRSSAGLFMVMTDYQSPKR